MQLRHLGTATTDDKLECLIVSIHAQMLTAVAHTFSRKYASISKMSTAMLTEVHHEMLLAFSVAIAHVRKHLESMLNDAGDALASMLLKMAVKLPTLQRAAIATLQLSDRLNSTLQAEIAGAENLDGSLPSKRQKADKSNLSSKETSTKNTAAKKADKKRDSRGVNKTPAPGSTTGSTSDLASLLEAQLSKKWPKSPEVEKELSEIRLQLNNETLRADRESQRADAEKLKAGAEKTRADGIAKELGDLRKALDKKHVGESSTSTSREASDEVKQLRSEVSYLRMTNSALTMLLGKCDSAAASLLQGAAASGPKS